jgi:hypothetical protein
VVGRTGFCIHPWDTVQDIPKVGGTKDVNLDKIRQLAPTRGAEYRRKRKADRRCAGRIRAPWW